MIVGLRKVGRLVEVRGITPFADGEIEDFTVRYLAALTRTSGRAVTCIDLRAAAVLPEEQSKLLVTMFRRTNPLLERSAILIDPKNATLCLQLTRIIREAANLARRAFTDTARLFAWLDEVLNKEEQARLRMFLSTLELDLSRARGGGSGPASSGPANSGFGGMGPPSVR
jgi:hypothetical protein